MLSPWPTSCPVASGKEVTNRGVAASLVKWSPSSGRRAGACS